MHRILQVGLTPKDNLKQWLSQEAIHSVIVLEPHPQQIQQLQQQYGDSPKLQVVAAAMNAEPGQKTLTDYSLPGFSSLSPATGLKRLFPGLQSLDQFEVKAFNPAQFLEQYGPTPDQTATLVLQAKGYEAELIQELVNHPDLVRFTDVLLYSAEVPLYEHSVETATLQKELLEAGYELIHEQAISPEWTESYFKRNTVQDEILLLRQQLKNKEQLESALAESATAHQQAVALNEQLTTELKQTKQAVAAEKALAQQQAQHAQQAQAGLEALQKECQDLHAQLAVKDKEQQTLQAQQQQLESALAESATAHQQAVALNEQLTTELKQTKQAVAAEKALVEKQAQQIKTLQTELEKAKQDISLVLENSKKELVAKDKSLAAQQQELISAKKNQQLMTEQLQTTEAKLKEHEHWLRNRKKQVEELEQALQQEQEKTQQLQAEKGVLAQLESRMEQLFNQQATQIQQATNALGKHVTKSFVDQRQHDQALTSLHQYLETGEQPLSFDAWSMGVDTLTYLVRQIEQNNYDVIIEFGSGTSTVVMAKAVAQRLTSQRYSQITKNDNSKHLPYEDIEIHAMPSVSGSQATTLLDSAEYDLPRQILSFEQDRNYLNQTKQALASHGVSQLVELVLAPLVPSTHSILPSEQKPLFYDCDKQLERLARLFEQRNARILVVVDGPFSPKNNPLIREPALGSVLRYLSAQHLDILLDDSHRSGEQQVLEHWQELCEERGLSYKAQALDVVKGATWVTVRPE